MRSPARRSEVASLALLLSPGVGNARVLQAQAAAQVLGKPLADLLQMPAVELIRRLPPGLADVAALVARCRPSRQVRAAQLAASLERRGARLLDPGQRGYPAALRICLGGQAPALLSVQGDLGLLDKPAGAIVGARHVSPRGAALAKACARAFVNAGIPVVSGGAYGVDLTAHTAALAAGGKTVVVLPQGLLTYTPARFMQKALSRGRAALVSQVPPGACWETHAAVTRNATISALARMVCVIEPNKTGGSIRTARHALAQGKRLLVHCADAAASTGRMLACAGAHDLLGPGGSFSEERLLDLWASAPVEPRGQGHLFEQEVPCQSQG